MLKFSNIIFLKIMLLYFIAQSDSILNGQNLNQGIQNGDWCIKCHQEIELMPEGFTHDDVHMQEGLSCSGCHGGDPTSEDEIEAMSMENNFIGIPHKKDMPQFCGKCHSNIDFMRKFQPNIQTDQVYQYFTSKHGIGLQQGDENVADCVSCHSSHGILKATDPRSPVYSLNIPSTCNKCHGDSEMMEEYNLNTNQYEDYAGSIHGIALLENQDTGSPACNDCHGNHGAIPPQVESISHVCGTCHLNNMNIFEKSTMSENFRKSNLHACEPCHGYHGIKKTSDEMIGAGNQSVCLICHKKEDTGYIAGLTIKRQLDDLVNIYDTADSVLLNVKIKGMNDAEIEYALRNAKQKLIQSRTAVHSFDTLVVGQIVNEGINFTDEALKIASSEMDEYYRRREGFIYTSIIFLILGISIFLKIRNNN